MKLYRALFTLWHQYVRLVTIKYFISDEIIVIGEKMKIQQIKKSITEKEYKNLIFYTRGDEDKKAEAVAWMF